MLIGAYGGWLSRFCKAADVFHQNNNVSPTTNGFISEDLSCYDVSMDNAYDTMAKDIFPVSEMQQEGIYKHYLSVIDSVKKGAQGVFFPSLVDVGLLRKFCQNENKQSLVIDVGGTYLKLAKVEIKPRKDSGPNSIKYTTSIKVYKFDYTSKPDEAPLKSQKWHDWVASMLSKNFERGFFNGIENAALTFSFAMNQTRLDKATIHSISKDWKFAKPDGFMEEDIVECLNSSLESYGLNFKVNCILNDSIATYVVGILRDRKGAYIGFINGTGSNAAYEISIDGQTELVNSEMAKTKLDDSILTKADRAVIETLDKKGDAYNLLEVLIAGYKFSEIVKEQACLLMGPNDLCVGKLQYVNNSYIVNLLHQDDQDLDEADILVKRVSLAFKRRASRICAALLTAISTEISQEHITIITNGSVILHDIDRNMLEVELSLFSHKMGLNKSYCFVSAGSASVEGAAFVSLALLNRHGLN